MHPRYLRLLSTSQHPCHMPGTPPALSVCGQLATGCTPAIHIWRASPGLHLRVPRSPNSLQVSTEPLPVVVWQRPQPLIPEFPIVKGSGNRELVITSILPWGSQRLPGTPRDQTPHMHRHPGSR